MPPHPHRAGATVQRIGVLAASLLVVTLVVHGLDLATGGILDRSGRIKGGDFFEFYALATIASEGRWDEVSSDESHEEIVRQRVSPQLRLGRFVPSYSPLVAALLAPLAWLPFTTALGVFSACSVAAYAAGIAMLLRRADALRAYWKLVALCAAAYPGMAVLLRSGQLTAASWLLIAVAASAVRPWIGGTAIGLLAYKPHLLAPPAAILAIRRQGRWILWLLGSVVLQVVITVLIAGVGPTLAYVRALAALVRKPGLIEPFAETDHSIRSLAPSDWPAGSMAVLQAAAVAAALAAVWYVWSRSADWRLRWSALTTAMLAGSPHVMTYDLMLLGIPILLMCDWMLEHVPARRRAWICVLTIVYFLPAVSPPLAAMAKVQLSVPIIWLLLAGLCLAARRPPATAVAEPA